MIVFLTIFSLLPQPWANLYCIGSGCTSCSQGYRYQSKSCLSVCPTGYMLDSSLTSCTSSSSQSLFSLQFSYFYDFSASQIADFAHPQGISFSDTGKNSPVPTVDRGFYFVSTSGLISNTLYIPAPDFTLRMLIKINADGKLFQISSGTTSFLTVYSLAGILYADWTTQSASSSAVNQVSTTFTYNSWFLPVFITSQQNGYLQLSGITSSLQNIGKITTQINITSFEISASQSYNFIFGDLSSGSFTGHIIEAYGDNSVINGLYTSTLWYDAMWCDVGDYYYQGRCSLSANAWPLQVRDSTNLCYSTNCTSCTGYDYASCTACSFGSPPGCSIGLNCLSGSTFACTQCQVGYVLIDGLCLYPPYNYNPSLPNNPAIQIIFNTFEQFYGGFFQSGLDASNYAPFNSPDFDDPIPMLDRGLYFNGDSFLQSIDNFVLNYKFTMIVWIYTCSGYCVYFDNVIGFCLGYSAWMTLHSYEEYEYLDIWDHSIGIVPNTWQYAAMTVDFIDYRTVITMTNSTNVLALYSLDGMVFYNYQSISNIWPWGFLYSITIWQTAVYDFSAQVAVCGVGLGTSCFSVCNQTSFYDPYQGICVNMQTSLTSISCGVWGTQNLCVLDQCGVCSDDQLPCFINGTNRCVSGFVADNSTLGSCNVEIALYNWIIPLICKTCPVGYYRLEQVCYTECPLGYSVASDSCAVANDPFLSLQMSVVSDKVTDSVSKIAFKTGIDGKFYPNGTSSDPIPAKNRGYYFNSTSYMNSSVFILPYNFSMVFWVKTLTDGVLVTKDSLVINSNADFTLQGRLLGTQPHPTTQHWTVMAFSLFICYNGTMTVNISYSDSQTSYFTQFNNFIFLDSNSSLTLGDPSSSFQGFLWQFLIFSFNISLSTFSISICDYDFQQDCLWDCNLDSYLLFNKCESCLANCSNGCINSVNCSLCIDSHCTACSTFETSSCTECLIRYKLENNECEECIGNIYFDPVSQTCENCPALCTTCLNADTCLTCAQNSFINENVMCICVDGYYPEITTCEPCVFPCSTCSSSTFCDSCQKNSHLNPQNACECDQGYDFTGNSCDRLYFVAYLLINKDNTIALSFSQPLQDPLTTANLNLTINQNPPDYTIQNISNQLYNIKIQSDAISSSDVLNIQFLSELVSNENYLLSTQHLNGTFYDTASTLQVKALAQMQAVASKGTTAGTSAAIGLSLLNLNPVIFFVFLNFLEIYLYLVVLAVKMPESFYKCLQGLDTESLFMSKRSSTKYNYKGGHIDTIRNNLGFETGMMAKNSMIILMVFAFILVLFLSGFVLKYSKNNKVKEMGGKIQKVLKYKAFLRFYVQTCLKLTMCSFLGIFLYDFSSTMGIVDFCLSICVLVFVI
jgi:hypothetical protein